MRWSQDLMGFRNDAPIQQYLTGRGCIEPGQQAQEGGFAATGRTKDGGMFSSGNRKGHVGERGVPIVDLGHRAKFAPGTGHAWLISTTVHRTARSPAAVMI